MDSDFAKELGGLLEAALGMLQGFFWIIIVVAGFLFNRRQQKQAASTPTAPPKKASSGGYRERAPIDPANQPGFGSTYAPSPANAPRSRGDNRRESDRRMNRPEMSPSASDDPLSFGSLFDQRDDEPYEQRTGQRTEQTKWGFDETEWGSSFGPKKSSEPTITQG